MPYQPIVERCINDAWNGVSVSKYYAAGKVMQAVLAQEDPAMVRAAYHVLPSI